MTATDSPTFTVTICRRTYPLDTEFVTQDLFWDGLDTFGEVNPQRAKLANLFALSDDYRLRIVAAQSQGLTRENALLLSRDACLRVREYISQNDDALKHLSGRALIALGKSDHTIAANLMGTHSPFDEATRKTLGAELIKHYAHQPVFMVNEIITNMNETARRPRFVLAPEPETSDKISVSFVRCQKDRAMLNYAGKHCALDACEVTSILDHLLKNPDFVRNISSLLNYPDIEVLEYVAEHIVTNPRHLEKLLDTGSRRIGRAALNNEAANGVTSLAVKAFLGTDAALIDEILTGNYDILQNRIAGLYRDDNDSAIREVVARYDREAKSRNAWLNSDEDENEDDDDEIGTDPMPENGICGIDDDDDLIYLDDPDADDELEDEDKDEDDSVEEDDKPIKPAFVL